MPFRGFLGCSHDPSSSITAGCRAQEAPGLGAACVADRVAAGHALRRLAGSTIMGHILTLLLDLPVEKLILIVSGGMEQVERSVRENLPDISLHMVLVDLNLAKTEENLTKRNAIQRLNDFALKQNENGGNVAIPFRCKSAKDLPAFWNDIPVIDGESHDLRFLDPRVKIVGLPMKGKAAIDSTGFVQEIS